MQGFKTEGVILKRRNFGEADRIISIFSKKEGKISILARGVRKITSRRAGNVELLNRVIVFLHPGKNFHILTEAETLNSYQKIKEDLTLSTYAYHIIELIDKLLVENQENIFVYHDLLEVLQRLELTPRQIYIRAFEVKILARMGFWSLDQVHQVKIEILNILDNLENLSWMQIDKLEINKEQAQELEMILRNYLEKVLEKRLHSREFLKKL